MKSIAEILRSRMKQSKNTTNGREEQVLMVGNEMRYSIVDGDIQVHGVTDGSNRSIALEANGECWAWIYHVTELDRYVRMWTEQAGSEESDLTYYHAALLCKVARQIR